MQLITQDVRQPEAFHQTAFTHIQMRSFPLQVKVEEESGVAAYLRHADVPHITSLPGGCTVTTAPCDSVHATSACLMFQASRRRGC